ncbi:MAG TPA: hypothetical protein VKP58_12325 [Candidatus Acidoferrum sp.]|nr:hypothetical protein [Candidatus Acidoferrum sp.]
MKSSLRTLAFSCGILLLAAVSGCKQKPSDDEAVRAAVREHLSSLGTLNMQAFETDFTNIAIQNNQATADVSFRPKTGAPAGAAMQVSYQLEKREGNWRVVKKSTPGGMIQHPDPNANPHTPPVQGEVHGKLPNFQDMLGSGAPSSGSLPPAPAQQPAGSKP